MIKDEKGGQIRLDMDEVKFYFYSSLTSVISPGAWKIMPGTADFFSCMHSIVLVNIFFLVISGHIQMTH